jgi:hypothetical protein
MLAKNSVCHKTNGRLRQQCSSHLPASGSHVYFQGEHQVCNWLAVRYYQSHRYYIKTNNGKVLNCRNNSTSTAEATGPALFMQKMTSGLRSAELQHTSPPPDHSKGELKVHENKVTVSGKVIPNIWLRDNCQCSSCMHPSTKQRLLDTFSIPEDLSIKKHTISKEQGLKINWSDGHESEYTQHFLSQTIKPYESRAVVRLGLTPTALWDSSIASDPPRVVYSDDSPAGIATLLKKIVRPPLTPPQPKLTRPSATIRLLLRRRNALYSLGNRVSPPAHRLHPRNALRRLLRLHRRPRLTGHSVHQHCTRSTHRQHVLFRPGRPASVPPPLAHGRLRRRLAARRRLPRRAPAGPRRPRGVQSPGHRQRARACVGQRGHLDPAVPRVPRV